jgi:hypothetical protein
MAASSIRQRLQPHVLLICTIFQGKRKGKASYSKKEKPGCWATVKEAQPGLKATTAQVSFIVSFVRRGAVWMKRAAQLVN